MQTLFYSISYMRSWNQRMLAFLHWKGLLSIITIACDQFFCLSVSWLHPYLFACMSEVKYSWLEELAYSHWKIMAWVTKKPKPSVYIHMVEKRQQLTCLDKPCSGGINTNTPSLHNSPKYIWFTIIFNTNLQSILFPCLWPLISY